MTKLVTRAMARKIGSVTMSADRLASEKGPKPWVVATLAARPTAKPATAAERVPKRIPAQMSPTSMTYGSSAAPLGPMSTKASPLAPATRTASARTSVRVRRTMPRRV
jgi:hypothetical protein